MQTPSKTLSMDAGTPAPAPATTSAPAPAGGFSFGGTPAPAPAATSAPAPAGGFSFGEIIFLMQHSLTPPSCHLLGLGTPAPAPATTSAPAPAGGFSFGGLSSTATPSTALATAAAPAGTTTSTGAGGVAAPAALASQAAPSAEVTSLNTLISEYRSKTVAEITNDWNKQLREDAATFTTEALKVAAWDTQLRDNQKAITELADQVQRMLLVHQELENKVTAVSTSQTEMDQALQTLETQVDGLFKKNQSRVPDDADVEREQTYQLAIDLDQQLTTMLGTLRDVVKGLNESFSAQSDSSSTVVKIIKVLNAHHHSLSWLETSAKKLQVEVGSASREMRATAGSG
ncbi:unnamed protein product [Chrysoparadoxa australica]